MLSHSLFQTEVLVNTGPERVRRTCEDGQLPPRRIVFQWAEIIPAGLHEWLIDNCQEGSISIHSENWEAGKLTDEMELKPWETSLIEDGAHLRGLIPSSFDTPDTKPHISCMSCNESPYYSGSEPEEGEDMTEEVIDWLKTTRQKVILATGVAGVSLGLLIMAFS